MSKRSAPDFALSFSNDAVHLMERADPPAAASVRWKERAVAAFDAPDFRAEMARLRKLVANGRDAKVALIIPDDQILYTSLPIPGDDHKPAELGQALDGLTPYPVADLAWDWRPSAAGDVRVAAVARQTLREAEDFARRHGFAAAGFLADPADGLFPATPRFGEPVAADEVLGDADLPGDLPADQPEATASQAAAEDAPVSDDAVKADAVETAAGDASVPSGDGQTDLADDRGAVETVAEDSSAPKEAEPEGGSPAAGEDEAAATVEVAEGQAPRVVGAPAEADNASLAQDQIGDGLVADTSEQTAPPVSRMDEATGESSRPAAESAPAELRPGDADPAPAAASADSRAGSAPRSRYRPRPACRA